MNLTLAKRHHGMHQVVRVCPVPGRTCDYVTYRKDPLRGPVPVVREDKLLAAITENWPDFLPMTPDRILLMVSDGDGGGDAVGEPRRFRPWGKYFDAYSLTLERNPRTKPKKETAT